MYNRNVCYFCKAVRATVRRVPVDYAPFGLKIACWAPEAAEGVGACKRA